MALDPSESKLEAIERPSRQRLLSQTLLILFLAGRTGAADFRHRYTWRSWVTGWLVRGVLEVLFFASIGVMLRDPQIALYLVIGRSLLIGATETTLTIQTVSWERQDGTMPFLLMGSTPAWAAFVGRSLQWLPSATATPLLLLFILGPLLGLQYDLATAAVTAVAVPLSAFASFGFSMAIAAVVVAWPEARNLVANVAIATVALLCGAFVPVSTWPEPVQLIAQTVPLTHIIETVTSAVLQNDLAESMWRLSLAAALGIGWFVGGIVMLERFVERGRRASSVDSSD